MILAAITNRRQTTVKNLIRRQDIIIITEVFDFLIISLGVIVSFIHWFESIFQKSSVSLLDFIVPLNFL